MHFVQGALTEGWALDTPEGMQIHLLTDAEIFGWSRPKPRVRVRRVAAAPETPYADLEAGDTSDTIYCENPTANLAS